MLPGIDLRLQNVLKALEEVVLPALPADQRLARDQAMLVIGHVRIIAAQWRHAAQFESGSLKRMAGLGRVLLAEPTAGLDDARRAALTDLLGQADGIDPSDLVRIEALIVELGMLIDAVIATAGRPGPTPSAVMDAVLAYGDAQAHRERVWFSANKLDPDMKELETIATMLAAD